MLVRIQLVRSTIVVHIQVGSRLSQQFGFCSCRFRMLSHENMKYLFCVHSPRRARDSAWRFDLVFFRLLSPGGAVGEYSREGSSRPRCRGVRREGGKGIGGQGFR
jgi:hypothetical protein